MTQGNESPDPQATDQPESQRGSGELLPRRTDLGKNMIEGSRVYFNLGQRVIITTRDKLKLSLIESVPRYSDLGVLIGKVGIFLALLLAILTTETKDAFGLSAQVWSTVLVLSIIVTGLWLAREVYRYANRKSIDEIVDAVIKDSEE